MKPKRSLGDIFNVKSLKQGALATIFAVSPSGIALADIAPQSDCVTPTASAPPAVPAVQLAAPPAVPKLSPDEQLFRANYSGAMPLSVQILGEDARISYYMKQICFSVSEAANDKREQDRFVTAALSDLGTDKVFGRALLGVAEDRKLEFCALGHPPAGVAAQYMPSRRIVAEGRIGSAPGQVLVTSHELLHASQDQRGLLGNGHNWDLESRVRRGLAAEAAPVALETAIAYEKKLAGDDSYWKYITGVGSNSAYRSADNQKAFEKAYNDGIASGETQADALRAAAQVMFERVFASDDWRTFYLNYELGKYVSDLADKSYAGDSVISHGAFQQSQLDDMGRIGDQPSFTKGATVPTMDVLLGADKKMRWAYEAADIARLQQMVGNQAAVKQQAEDAARAGNPYIGLDFSDVEDHLTAATWSGKYQTIPMIMDQMLAEKARAVPAPAKTCMAPLAPAVIAPPGPVVITPPIVTPSVIVPPAGPGI